MMREVNGKFVEEGVIVPGDGKRMFPRDDGIHVCLEGTGKFSKFKKTGQCFTLGDYTIHG